MTTEGMHQDSYTSKGLKRHLERLRGIKLNKEFLVNNYHWIILLAIFAFAIWIRSFSFDSPYVNADDPYRGLRLVQYFVENGSLPEHDTLINYPNGAYPSKDYLLWYYIPGIIGLIFKSLGFSNPALLAAHFYPVFFGGLMVLATYFLVKELIPRKDLALLAAFFIAVAAPIIIRTTPPSAIKEPIAGFFMLVSMLYYVKSLKKFDWRYSVVAGLFVILMNFTWGGVAALIAVYTAFVGLMVLLNRFDKNFGYTSITLFGTYLTVSFLMKLILGGGVAPAESAYEILAGTVALLAIIGAKLLDEKYNFIPTDLKQRFGTYSIIIMGVLVFLAAFLYEPLGDKLFFFIERIFTPLAASSGEVVGRTVAYFRPSSLTEVVAETGIGYFFALMQLPSALLLLAGSFVLSLVGLAALSWRFYKKSFPFNLALFLGAWFFSSLILGIGAVRLIFIAAFPIAIMGAIGAYYGILVLYRKAVSYNANLKWAVFALMAFLIFLHAGSGYVLGKNIGPSMSPSWVDALTWVQNNSEPDQVVMSWWDYGYLIHYYAQRPTYSDPGHSGGAERDHDVAEFFTSTNETEHLEWLKSLNVKYVVHDASMVGKYSAVSTIASNGKWQDQFMIFNFQETVCAERSGGQCSKQITKYQTGVNGLWLVQSEHAAYPVLIAGNRPLNVSSLCTPQSIITTDPQGVPGCAMFTQTFAAYLGLRCDSRGCSPHDLSRTMFAQMWFLEAAQMEHFKLAYSNGEIKVFEVIY